MTGKVWGTSCLLAAILLGATATATRGEVVPDGSRLAGNISIGKSLRIPPADIPDGYGSFADLNIYLTSGNSPQPDRIAAALRLAQKKLDVCRIFLRVHSVNYVVGPPLLSEWESMEFNNGLSPWERAFFSLTPRRSAGVVFVKRLDWTIGRDGITAVGYGGYLEEETDYLKTSRDRLFYRNHMAGYAVLGRSVGESSLIHELGHALLGLRHVKDRSNVMFSGLLARDDDSGFNERQCARGRANYPWVRPVPDRQMVSARPFPPE
ncbi:hypothetical protein [Thiohalomonas denitrificans]|uniref:Matrixin n=1 Tax=Thiohalomonas denitrificans TaxID=415747 RepID=A0A1G5PVI9_9GAMM|nr:hypothetical protein [Thiohalomonas denitrificans]SCZ53428.1 hypothetical protein SAMN03097708_00929 [Thiohalomonas denitrificans]